MRSYIHTCIHTYVRVYEYMKIIKYIIGITTYGYSRQYRQYIINIIENIIVLKFKTNNNVTLQNKARYLSLVPWKIPSHPPPTSHQSGCLQLIRVHII